MSDDIKDGNASASADPIKNLKAEMDRKLSNLQQTNEALIKQVQAMIQPKPAASSTASSAKLEDVWFDKPEEAASRIEERVLTKISKQQETAAKSNATIGQLVSEFPELSDNNSDLTKKAVEIYSSFSEDEKSSPVAYRAAVREAAMELGVSPKSKRQASSEDDTFSIGGSSSSREDRRAAKQMDQATLEFASIMGLDVNDKKVVERIKAKTKRNFNRYE